MPSWTPTLLTGHAAIDTHHQEIFARMDALHAAMLRGERSETSRLIEFLGQYVLEHFSAEEAIMESAQYPFLEPHRREHREFVRDYDRFREEFDAHGPTASLTLRANEWLQRWLTTHVTGTDVTLALHLRKPPPMRR